MVILGYLNPLPMNSTSIDLYDFLDLELVDRLIVLRANGVHVAKLSTTFQRSDLYTLGSFYVEVRTTRKNGSSTVHDALPFVKGPRLDKYLESIDLSPLMNSNSRN